MDKDVIAFKSQGTKLENRAQSVVIENLEQYKEAVDIVAKLKEYGSQIKEKKESLTKPANDILKKARLMFAPIEEQLKRAEGIIKIKLLDYKRKSDEEARAKEEKIASRVEAGTLKLETAEKKMEAIERVDNTTQGSFGDVQIRTNKKVRIINESLLPREYLVPDNVAIRRDALGGKQIPGVEVYEEESVAIGGK